MNKLKALRRFNYRGKDRDPGDVFEADSDIHEKLLLQQGSVEIVQNMQRPIKAAAKVEITAADNSAEVIPTKRVYKRRDMRAEE